MIKNYMEYVVSENLKVVIEEGENRGDCCLLKIKHTPTPRDMNGEILLPPCELPELIKALTSAALDATLRDNCLAGHADGSKKQSP